MFRGSLCCCVCFCFVVGFEHHRVYAAVLRLLLLAQKTKHLNQQERPSSGKAFAEKESRL